VTSCLNSVYGTFTGAFADGKKYRMSRKFAARIARNVSHARRGGMAGLGGVPAFGVPGVGEPDAGVGWPPRRGEVMLGVGMPNDTEGNVTRRGAAIRRRTCPGRQTLMPKCTRQNPRLRFARAG